MPGDGKTVVRQKLYIPNDTNGGFEQSRPPFFYSLKNNATMLSNMAANGNNCHEAQSMPTNSDEIYIKKYIRRRISYPQT